MKLAEGMRVRLAPFEGNPRETGIILTVGEGRFEGIVSICLDWKYRKGSDDDGCRELTVDQIEWVG